MAKRVKEVILGIDVGKRHLEASSREVEAIRVVENKLEGIERFLDQLSGPVVIAVEATNTYHELLVDLALARGFTVYVIDGYRLEKYREAVGVRAKTDPNDAHLIRRYLVSERAYLRALDPTNPQQRQLWRLIKRRAKVVKLRTQMMLSLSDLGPEMPEVTDALASLTRLINRLTKAAYQIAKTLGWSEALIRLRTIPGVGKLSALGLMAMYHRGEFTNADNFIAFLGLDVKVRDSGKYRGLRKLTKKGDPEIRRLLFNGARAAVNRWAHWKERKQQLMAKGFSEIQSSVILARKIARIGYAIMKTNEIYKNPEIA